MEMREIVLKLLRTWPCWADLESCDASGTCTECVLFMVLLSAAWTDGPKGAEVRLLQACAWAGVM